MNFTINIIHLAQSGACHSPDARQWTIIIVTLSPILVILGVSGTGIVAVATTLVTMLTSGASFDAIAAAITTVLLNTIGAMTASLEVVALLVNAVKPILGCQ